MLQSLNSISGRTPPAPTPTPSLWDTMGFGMVPGCECSRCCRVLPHISCAFPIESEINAHIWICYKFAHTNMIHFEVPYSLCCSSLPLFIWQNSVTWTSATLHCRTLNTFICWQSLARKIISREKLTRSRFELNARNARPEEPIWTSENSKICNVPYAFLKSSLQMKLLQLPGKQHRSGMKTRLKDLASRKKRKSFFPDG